MKKIVIGISVLVVVIAGVFYYLNNRNRTLSPPGNTELTVGELSVSIPYSRPSVRDRVIFGTEEEGALQPYGKYWRLGANEPTQVTFSKDVTFSGELVKAGTYRIYAFPGKESFEIRLNSEIGMWGASEPDYSKDFLKTQIPVQKTESLVEQFTINAKQSDSGINIIIEWANVRLVIPVIAQ
jgi:hypothetical protein